MYFDKHPKGNGLSMPAYFSMYTQKYRLMKIKKPFCFFLHEKQVWGIFSSASSDKVLLFSIQNVCFMETNENNINSYLESVTYFRSCWVATSEDT